MLVITIEGTYELERADALSDRKPGSCYARTATGHDGPAVESRTQTTR